MQELNWQSIETAPKDGSKVILWHSYSWDCQPFMVSRWLTIYDCWANKYDNGTSQDHYCPTHWLPFQEPPC